MDTCRYENAIVHIFHNAFWGNWFFEVKNVSASDRTISFGRGGFQESHGGGAGSQPFYVEGVKEALDSPGEWWIDESKSKIFYMPNRSTAHDDEIYSAPVLDRLVDIDGAHNISFEGIEFTFSAPTYLHDYVVPSPGDWAIHRGGAVTIQRSYGISFTQCAFLRLGGNAMYIGPGANFTKVESCEFAKIGDSAIITAGDFDSFDGTLTRDYPDNTMIANNHIHEIGVTGKQTSALFSALTSTHKLFFKCSIQWTKGGHQYK